MLIDDDDVNRSPNCFRHRARSEQEGKFAISNIGFLFLMFVFMISLVPAIFSLYFSSLCLLNHETGKKDGERLRRGGGVVAAKLHRSLRPKSIEPRWLDAAGLCPVT